MAKYTNANNTEVISRLVGAKVMFKSLPIYLLKVVKNYYKDKFTIKKIHVKISELGNTKILIELEELPRVLINPDLLELLEYIPGVDGELSAICGTFLCCQVLCGKGVEGSSVTPNPDEDEDYDGIIIEDLDSLSSILESIK